MAKIFPLLLLLGALSSAEAAQPLTNLEVVVIDAGHGGEDPGAKRGDAADKGACFLVVQALKETISRENGASVTTVLTFGGETVPGQAERAYTANKSGGKVFVSIHGYQTKQREAGIYIAAPDPTGSWKDAGTKYAVKSRLLADSLRSVMEIAVPGKRFFVGSAPLVMFYGVAMPAVAVEAVPLDSPVTPEAATNVANAIYSALLELGRRP